MKPPGKPPMNRPARFNRSAFKLFRPLATRWIDNDAYGHVNNVHYYSYFDTAVNSWLVEEGLLRIGESPVIGLVVESGCTYFESVAFPESLEAGIAVAHLGRSSVRYRIGIFKAGADRAAAQGHFVHVHVDRMTRQPVDLPPETRAALSALISDDR
jgi:acyl-CoA thioester hydrolase